ncbi:hypothetical protein [Dinghuibacter silviterrae]|uniref:hypothetical protein n=1 Tax=Dinghuibacter silviterrae TaxID=1539049 RepID=UPI0010645D6A|nr:hypothetical protein [Dinghuibacter silviterrae]
MNDINWLYNFFDRNKADLHGGFFGSITSEIAVLRTLNEAEKMEDLLYDFLEEGFNGSVNNLQHLFKPLNNFEYTIANHQKSKARIRNGWLRVYAIRLAKNCYLVTGGAIKLSADMKRDHLQLELKKLELSKQFLRFHGIDYPEDLNNYNDE